MTTCLPQLTFIFPESSSPLLSTGALMNTTEQHDIEHMADTISITSESYVTTRESATLVPKLHAGVNTPHWFNVFNIRLHWSKKEKNNLNRKQELAGKKVVAKESVSAAETVLNNAGIYGESGARERRLNNTEHCHEAKLTRAIGKEAKYPTTQKITDFSKFKIRASRCCAAAQEK